MEDGLDKPMKKTPTVLNVSLCQMISNNMLQTIFGEEASEILHDERKLALDVLDHFTRGYQETMRSLPDRFFEASDHLECTFENFQTRLYFNGRRRVIIHGVHQDVTIHLLSDDTYANEEERIPAFLVMSEHINGNLIPNGDELCRRYHVLTKRINNFMDRVRLTDSTIKSILSSFNTLDELFNEWSESRPYVDKEIVRLSKSTLQQSIPDSMLFINEQLERRGRGMTR